MNATNEHAHAQGGSRLYVWVWVWLLALTGLETMLAYQRLPVKLMLVLLMGLSVVKGSLIIAYFMHLRFEKRSLALTLMPALVVCICLLFMFFPDGIRLLALRPR